MITVAAMRATESPSSRVVITRDASDGMKLGSITEYKTEIMFDLSKATKGFSGNNNFHLIVATITVNKKRASPDGTNHHCNFIIDAITCPISTCIAAKHTKTIVAILRDHPSSFLSAIARRNVNLSIVLIEPKNE
jgi:hypothetical protein